MFPLISFGFYLSVGLALCCVAAAFSFIGWHKTVRICLVLLMLWFAGGMVAKYRGALTNLNEDSFNTLSPAARGALLFTSYWYYEVRKREGEIWSRMQIGNTWKFNSMLP
jgi:hypothetical protein